MQAQPQQLDRPLPERTRITYDTDDGHVCTKHGRTAAVDTTVAPTQSGAYFYVCTAPGCGASGWSGL